MWWAASSARSSASRKAPRADVGCGWHGERRLDRVDAAHQIMVLRRRFERRDLLAAEREEDVARDGAERLHGRTRIGNLGPAISRDSSPRRPAQRQQRDAGEMRGAHRVGGHLRRIGMRRINQAVDALCLEIVGEPLGAAKTADAQRHRMRHRIAGAPGERQRDLEIAAGRESLGRAPRLRRRRMRTRVEFPMALSSPMAPAATALARDRRHRRGRRRRLEPGRAQPGVRRRARPLAASATSRSRAR